MQWPGLRPNFAVLALGLALLVGIEHLLDVQQPTAARLAEQLAGERWLQIHLGEQHVGYMHNHAYRDLHGDYHFFTSTHFLLDPETPNTITKHLQFASKAPFALVAASYVSRRGTNRQRIELQRQAMGYNARLDTPGAQKRNVDLDWQFSLTDFLAFESWLLSQQPGAGQRFPVSSIDFEKLHIGQRTYTVVEHNQTGYLVENNSPFAVTRTQLDASLQPDSLTMEGVFEMRVSNRTEALNVTGMQNRASYAFAVDQRLVDYKNLSRLSLRVHNAPPRALPSQLTLTAGTAVGSDPLETIGEALAYPLSHPDVQQLAQQAMAESQTRGTSLVDELVRSVHLRLRYAEHQSAPDVATALARGYGECTDYADLFTTAARAAGLPARTVFGLAYKDGARPTFLFHAWNEVYENNRWRAVDPTWDQIQADATHILLTEEQAAALMLAHNTASISFEVLDSQL